MKRLVLSHEKWYDSLLFLLILSNTAQHSQVLFPIYQQVRGGITAVCLIIFVCMVFTARITKAQLIAMCVTGTIGMCIFALLGRTLFLYYSFLLILSRGKDIDRIYQIIIRTIGSIFIFNILCTVYFMLFDVGRLYVRITPHHTRPQLDLSCGGHPNSAALFFVVLSVMILYKKWDRLKLKHWLLLTMLSILTYWIIGSEAVFFAPLIAGVWMFRNSKAANRVLRLTVRYGVLLFLLFSLIELWIPKIPGLEPFADWLNTISSGRFMLSQRALEHYPPTLFGSNAEYGHLVGSFGEDLYIYADNAYVNMLIKEGAVYLILLQWVLFKTAGYLEYREEAILLLLLLYGIAETSMLSYMTIFPLICAMWCYYEGEKVQ